MQTFLPVPDFDESARLLDRQRLGKQRIEAKQLLLALDAIADPALATPRKGWMNHPCTRMWFGYERALAHYGMAVCDAWIARGYQDNTRPFFAARAADSTPVELPWWLGDAAFHHRHRSRLVAKQATHYAPLFPDADPALGYLWPVTSTRSFVEI
jgi:hypothetical protein